MPNINVTGKNTLQVGYLYKDLLAAVNTQGTLNTAGLTPSPAGIYSQTGINLVTFTLNSTVYNPSEMGGALHIPAGFEWMFDGVKPVEHNFFVWPEDITAVWSATGGSIHAQPDGATNTNAYYYQVCYEWTDGSGMIHRSAPSIPVAVTTTSTGTSGSITVNVPYARLTYKTANKIRIVIYRWSVANQDYYRVTSVSSPTLNNPAADSVAFVDTLADASIIGNDLIYTTGGVVEDIGAPGFNAQAMFDDRLWGVEDTNLLWFSKQVIQGTPVEFSDLFTLYIAPTSGAQGGTGPITAIAVMGSYLIIFKRDAIYYINGTGPDNTGANNQYNGPIYITSTVGTDNPNSVVLTPNGLMFQSDKGIWMLNGNLETQYIGSPVESYTTTNIGTVANTVTSALCIPGTNQVRFTMSNDITLMYDYFYGQWATFTNTPAISSTVYQGLHTYLNIFGQVLQETPGIYLDISVPVVMSFTTSWIKLAGLQGYERFYHFLLLGNYISPHQLIVQIAYDYNPAPVQQSIITPLNYNAPWGGDPTWGASTPWGGTPTLEQWKVHVNNFGQKCQAFQITLTEAYNPIFGNKAGAGLTLSNLNCVVGIKKGYRPIRASNSVG